MTKIPSNDLPPAQPSGGSSTPGIIVPDVHIDGNVRTAGELQLDGSIKGDIDCGGLVMGETGSIEGMITAKSVTVRGRVKGEIRAGSVSLEKTAIVEGDIYHETLTVQAGAKLTGKLSQTDDISATTKPSVGLGSTTPAGLGSAAKPAPASGSDDPKDKD